MLWNALIDIHKALGRPDCWYYGGAFHFDLGGEWTLGVSVDSMSRVRLATCHCGLERATFWAPGGDTDRLALIARQARDEVLTSTAEYE